MKQSLIICFAFMLFCSFAPIKNISVKIDAEAENREYFSEKTIEFIQLMGIGFAFVSPHDHSKNFPEATQFTEWEMNEWKKFGTDLFRMAKDRGIETYIINWNTFVSPSFACAHNTAVTAFCRDQWIYKPQHKHTRTCVGKYPRYQPSFAQKLDLFQ